MVGWPSGLRRTTCDPTGHPPQGEKASAVVYGGMAERLKAHAWKACVGKLTVGSNPTPTVENLPVTDSSGFEGLRQREATPGRESDASGNPTPTALYRMSTYIILGMF